MRRISRLFGALVLTILVPAQSVNATGDCVFGAAGAYREAQSTAVYGVRSNLDFVSAYVGSGELIIHRFRVETLDGDSIDWGTYKGAASSVLGCPNDTTNWSVYAGLEGPDDCISLTSWPEYSGGDSDIEFKMSFGSCSAFPYDVWRVFTNGTRRDCYPDNYGYGQPYLDAFVFGASVQRLVDIHYDDVARMSSSGTWVNWSGGASCADSAPSPGYRVRLVGGSNSDMWLEKVP